MKPGTIIESFQTKKGHTAVIRYLRPEDINDVMTFANNLSHEDTFVLLNGETLTLEEEQKYMKEAIEGIEQNKKIHLIATVDGAFAANCSVHREKRRKSHVGEIAISVAPPFREEGIGSLLMQALIDEGKKIGITLFTLTCFEINERALHVYDKIGFQRAGVIPRAYSYHGGFENEVILYLDTIRSNEVTK